MFRVFHVDGAHAYDTRLRETAEMNSNPSPIPIPFLPLPNPVAQLQVVEVVDREMSCELHPVTVSPMTQGKLSSDPLMMTMTIVGPHLSGPNGRLV